MFFKKSLKPQQDAVEETQSESTDTVLTGDEFCYLNLRHWSDLTEDDLPSLHFGALEIVDATPLSVRESGRGVGSIEFASLQRYSLAVGICRKAHFQYKVFGYNHDTLLDTFSFDENGLVSYKGSNLTEIYIQVNALWQNMIVSGQKFLHWIEADLADRFGEDSDQFKAWRQAFAEAADVSLACDLCFRMPSIIEQEFLFVNTTDVDLNASTVGFAISLDQGFMDHDLGDSLREKVFAIASARLSRGLSPQLAVNELADRFYVEVSLLYAHYLATMTSDADLVSDLVEKLSEDSFNCIVRTEPLQAGELSRPTKMVYRMPNPSMVEYYRSISERIRSKLS